LADGYLTTRPPDLGIRIKKKKKKKKKNVFIKPKHIMYPTLGFKIKITHV